MYYTVSFHLPTPSCPSPKLLVSLGHAVAFQNFSNGVPVVHSLSDGEIAEIVLDNNKHEDDDSVITSDMVKLCNQAWNNVDLSVFMRF